MEQEELGRLEARCIQEQPPACAAACPVHVDARGMAAAIAKGDFASAARIYRKTVPFPGIISRICDRPCQAICRRGEVGAAVSIRDLEKACLDWAGDLKEGDVVLPKKDRRIAVVGAGLSGLTAAFDLARKGYSVEVFEKEARPGGSLFRFPAGQLPEEVIEADLKALEKVGVIIRTNVTVGENILLNRICEEFDAVYLATGEPPSGGFAPPFLKEGRGDLAVDEQGQVVIDPVTLATTKSKVFAGGSIRRARERPSPIESMADGRRAAVSIDRALQNVSLTAARAGEGSYQTRLFTSTEGVEPAPAVPMAGETLGYSMQEAVLEAKRCIQCQCLECVKVCEYLNSFGSYPKKYIRQIYNNLAIVMGHRHANKLINSCSLCGLCREVCPEDLHMGLVCKKAREVMVSQGRMPPSAHDFPIRDMIFSNSETCALARLQPGTDTSRRLFFPGCQLSASAPEHVRKTYGLLCQKLSGGVGLMLRCCGAPAEWSGRTELFSSSLRDIRALWEEMEKPEIILACSTCYEIFKTHLPEAGIVSLWEVLDNLGLPEAPPHAAEPSRTLAVHDACSTRHEKKVHESVRNILRRTGFEIEELPLSREKTECCGYGGLMFFANPDLARNLISRRIQQSESDYLAYCAMCRDYLASGGKRTLHLLDLVLGAPIDEAAQQRGPGYTLRRENRVRLKNTLLKDLWRETPAGKETFEMIRLNISNELRELLEQRQILDSDIQQVVDFAERSGVRLHNRRTGRFLAHHKPVAVTYWVEYTPSEGEFIIHNAYSHRMEISEEINS
ncbi:MAG TPA: FAD-dependent oxidoreductase [Syntrophobacteraceae bacterium]|nr:FAD-dependent oxidoreductase [Syntrophobacteraceae bacterium]